MAEITGDSHYTREAEALLFALSGDFASALAVLERQLNALHQRAQMLLGFAAVAVTTTGFSGRLIAGTSHHAQCFIIAGLSVIMLSCFWIFLRVLTIEWVISRCLKRDPVESLVEIIRYRDRKTGFYLHGCYGVFIGLTLYCIALALMLLNPQALSILTR